MSMTVEEAIAKFKRTSVLWESASNTEMVEAVKVAISALEEVKELHAIGTVSEFRELKEKATAKKSRWKYFRKEDIAVCENCSNEHFLGTKRQYATRFCPNCGSEMEN